MSKNDRTAFTLPLHWRHLRIHFSPLDLGQSHRGREVGQRLARLVQLPPAGFRRRHDARGRAVDVSRSAFQLA